MKILIVEDEHELLEEIKSFLEVQNFVCETAGNFIEGEDKIAIYEYDIAIIDITLPDGNGLELIDKLKELHPATGILIISARNSLDDKIKGLDLGADDYITKPFHLSELNSRVHAVIRRRNFNGQSTVIFNEIEIDFDAKQACLNNNPVALTKREFDLLLYFIINKNRVLTKEAIAEHLWGDNIDIVDNLDFVYTHINNLRKKISKAGGEDYIHSRYGVGYIFSDYLF